MVEIPALAISSTDCRERNRRGEPVWYLVPDGVVQYIAKHDLYAPDIRRRKTKVTATDRAVELVVTAARAASDKLASQIVAFDVSDQLAITDAFLIASGSNDRQVKAIVDEVEDKLREVGAKPLRREGERDGRWVLIDYGEVVVHVQHEEERQFYALERLWRDCPAIDAAGRRRLPQEPGDADVSSWSVTDRPPGTPPSAPRGTPTSPSTRPATPRLPRRRRTSPRCARPLWSSDLARARETAAYVAEADRPRGRDRRAAARVRRRRAVGADPRRVRRAPPREYAALAGPRREPCSPRARSRSTQVRDARAARPRRAASPRSRPARPASW